MVGFTVGGLWRTPRLVPLRFPLGWSDDLEKIFPHAAWNSGSRRREEDRGWVQHRGCGLLLILLLSAVPGVLQSLLF